MTNDGSAAHAELRERETMEEFVGTALVLSFLQTHLLMPPARLEQLKAAAARHFSEIVTPSGLSFSELLTTLLSLTMSGILNTQQNWFVRARLFKLVLSQASDGFWDPCDTTAFAALARQDAEVDAMPPQTLLRRFTSILEAIFNSDAGGGARGAAVAIINARQEAALMAQVGASVHQGSAAKGVAKLVDCPLTFTVGGFAETLPIVLKRAETESPELPVMRVWTTLCCIAVLERMRDMWLAGNGDAYPSVEVTIVDIARVWIERTLAPHPKLAGALRRGALSRAASHATAVWNETWEWRVGCVRRDPSIKKRRLKGYLERTLLNLTRAVATKHDTMRVFFSAPSDGLQRWQSLMLLITLVITMLLVNIWMFYAKGQNCCTELRAILNSGPDGGHCPPVGDCRGFNGTCSQLSDQFALLPVLPDYPFGLQDFVCHAFPDEAKQSDTFVVALIAYAVALPTALFIASAFSLACNINVPQSYLNWSGPILLLLGRNAHREWNYTRAAPPTRYVRWYVRSYTEPRTRTYYNLCYVATCWLRGKQPFWRVQAEEAAMPELTGEADPQAAAAAKQEAADEAGQTMRQMMAVGLAATYVVWAIMSWFIFVYGMLIYKLLGAQVEETFARSFGISYALNAATQWQSMLQEALKGVAILLVLESLSLTSPVRWVEENVDYLSLESVVYGRRLSLPHRIAAYYSLSKRLVD